MFDKKDYTEKFITERLSAHVLSSPKYIIENLYVFKWESDLLLITKSGYYYEFEVKISLSDFKHDFTKQKKHKLLMKHKDSNDIPNYFYYAVPYFLAEKVVELIPEYAGLVVITKNGWPEIIKPAPKLHSNKIVKNLQDKFYYNWRNAKELNKKLVKEIKSMSMLLEKKTQEAV